MKEQNCSIADCIYKHIKLKIQDCSYMPGETLHEKQLYKQLECGRTPLREALLALKKENLMEIFPRSRICVKPLTQEYVNEIYQFWKLLESTVAAKFCQVYDKSVLLTYDDRFQTLDTTNDRAYKAHHAEPWTLDIEIHQKLWEAVGDDMVLMSDPVAEYTLDQAITVGRQLEKPFRCLISAKIELRQIKIKEN